MQLKSSLEISTRAQVALVNFTKGKLCQKKS